MGHGLTVSQTRFADGTIAPPASPDPIFYRKGLQLFLRDTLGIEHPVAVGADGLGVVALTVAQSPYDVQPTDRVLLIDTTDGPVTAKLPADGGPFAGRPLLVLDAKTKFGTNSFTLLGNGHTINGFSALVLSTDKAAASVAWDATEWRVVAGAGSASPPAAHADTHRAGNADDLLSAPGEIGGGTPSVVNVTRQRVHTSSIPSAEANKVLIYSFAANQLTQLHASGMKITDVAGAASATAEARRNIAVFSLAAGATKDITIAGGGAARISAAGATGSTGAFFTFADNGTTSTNGLTFTDFATSDTASKLCAYSGGANTLRIKNNLASGTAKIVLDLTEGAAV
jgi:hypothetical protein